MRCKPLYLLLLLALLQWKSSESASSDTKSSKDGIYFDEDSETKIEGSAFADTNDDTEDTDAKGEDDEDTFSVISGSGSDSIVEKTTVHITKPPKHTKKPVIVTKPKPEPTKPPAKPGKEYPVDPIVEINKERPAYNPASNQDPFINNYIPKDPYKPEPTTKSKESDEKEPEMVDDNNTSNEIGLMGRKTDEMPASFFAKPGILFAVIGGAIVGLLCAILLVMFIVYRMRKKDEGSYPLDEPRRSPNSNSYMRTSGKEFYA